MKRRALWRSYHCVLESSPWSQSLLYLGYLLTETQYNVIMNMYYTAQFIGICKQVICKEESMKSYSQMNTSQFCNCMKNVTVDILVKALH